MRLSVRMLPYLDRAMIPFVRKYPWLADELRSLAQLDLVRAEAMAEATENPVGYMLIVMTNAFRKVERKFLRSRRRWRPQGLEALIGTSIQPPDLAPDPATIAMAREEIAIRNLPPPTPPGHAIRHGEWELFRAIVGRDPSARNRRIAEQFNRQTGRKMNVYTVSKHRRRLGI